MDIKFKLYAVSILAFLLLVTSGSHIAAADGVSISMAPAALSVTNNKTFNVKLEIDCGTTEVRGWQGTVKFDPEKLTCNSVVAGDFFDQLGDIIEVEKAISIDNTAGLINLAYAAGSRTSGGAGDSGTLCTLNFKALSTTGNEPTELVLQDFLVADADIQAVNEVTLNNGSITIKAASSGGGGGGGGGGATASYATQISGFLSLSSLSTNSSGKTKQAYQITTVDGGVRLDIASGTTLRDSAGNRLETLTAEAMVSPPAAPEGYSLLSTYTLSPEGAQFNPDIGLALLYRLSDLPEGIAESSLFAAAYDGTAWVKLEDSRIDGPSAFVQTNISHFSNFALIGQVSLPETPLVPSETPAAASPSATASSDTPTSIAPTTTMPVPTPAPTPAPASSPTTTIKASTAAPATTSPAAAARNGSLSFSLADLTDDRGALKSAYASRLTLSKEQALSINLEMKSGTVVLTSDNQPLESINIVNIDPADTFLPDKSNLIAVFECSPSGSTFTPPLTLTLQYSPTLLPATVAEKNLKLAFFDASKGRWEILESGVDSVNHTVSAGVAHFTTFGLMTNGGDTASASSKTAPGSRRWPVYLIIGLVAAAVIILIVWLIRRRKHPAG